MAKAFSASLNKAENKKTIARPGIHSKKKSSQLKSSKNYFKKNVGQG